MSVASRDVVDGGSGAPVVHLVAKSVRLRGDTGCYFSRVPGTAGNRKKVAFRVRVKRGKLGVLQTIAAAGTSSVDRFYFDAVDRLCLDVLGSTRLVSTPVFRDPTGWYVDIGFELDVANATAALRAKILVNGTEVTYSHDSRGSIANSDTNWFNTVAHFIGRENAGNYLDGYIAEPMLCETVTSYSAEINGVRVPTAPQAAFGLGGSLMDFLDGTSASALGTDVSGNGHDWGATNISVAAGANYDWMDDTPSNNFAVFNIAEAMFTSGSIFINANLRVSAPVSPVAFSSFWLTGGKWHLEVICDNRGAASGLNGQAYYIAGAGGVTSGYNPDGTQRINGADGGAWGTIPSNTNVIGLSLDATGKTLEASLNGVSQGTKSFSTNGPYAVRIQARGAATNPAATINFGQRPFAYPPPSGFNAVNTANLGTITPTASGSFTGNAAADGPFVWLGGAPASLTINGNAVTWGTHAIKLAAGFKVITSSSSYNVSGSNTFSVGSFSNAFTDPAPAQVNP